jgi:hypothetical protein
MKADSCLSISALLPPSMARGSILPASHLWISLYQFFTWSRFDESVSAGIFSRKFHNIKKID